MPRSPPAARHGLAAALGLGLGLGGGTATASTGPAIGDFYAGQARSMGLAHRAVGTSPETLLLNPAGLASDPRYAVDLSYGYRGAAHLNDLSLSVVDAKSAPIAVGFQMARLWGNPSDLDAKLYRGALGFAYGGGGPLAAGVVIRRQWGEAGFDGARQDMASMTASLGALVRLGRLLAVGGSWENFIRPRKALIGSLSPGLGVGARVGGERLQAAADLRFCLLGAGRRPELALGAEGVLGGTTALRAGYRRAAGADTAAPHTLTLGVGALSPSGHLHLTLERRLGPEGRWSLATGLQMAL